MRQTRNTPAVTMVAAWISAETGVGPSIASGNQVCRKSCADLPMAPTNNRTPEGWPRSSPPQELHAGLRDLGHLRKDLVELDGAGQPERPKMPSESRSRRHG